MAVSIVQIIVIDTADPTSSTLESVELPMWYATIAVSVVFSILNPLPVISASAHLWTKFKSSSSSETPEKKSRVLLAFFITIVFLTAALRVAAIISFLIYLPYDELELVSTVLVKFIPDIVPLCLCAWYAGSFTQKGKDQEVYQPVSDTIGDNFQ